MRAALRLPTFLATLLLAIPACEQPTAEAIVDHVADAMMISGSIDSLTTLRIRTVFPDHDYPAEYLGLESLDGADVHVLRVVLPLGIPVTYFIDAGTWLPLKAVADVTVDGTEYHPERVFSDYADMGGVRYARTFTYSWVPDAVETATVEAVEINVPLGDDRFAVPDSLEFDGGV